MYIDEHVRIASKSNVSETVSQQTASAALLFLDAEGRVLSATPAWTRLSGYGLRESQGRLLSDLVRSNTSIPGYKPSVSSEGAVIGVLLRGESSEYLPDVFVHKLGHHYSVLCSVQPLVEQGHTLGSMLEVRKGMSLPGLNEEDVLPSPVNLKLFDQTQVGIASTDLTGRFLYANKAYCQLVERSESDLLDLRMQDITHPEDLAANLPLFQKAVQAGEAFSIVKRYILPDGRHRWVNNHVHALKDSKGQFREVVALSVDISEQKLLEERLGRQEASLRELTHTIPSIVWRADATGACTFVNRQWEIFSGEPFESASGWNWMAFLHPEDLHLCDSIKHKFSNGEPYELEYRLRRADGIYRWFIARSQPIYNSHGEISHWYGSCTDITEQKEAQTALEVSEERLKQITNSVPAIVWVADSSGAVSYISERWTEYTGEPVINALGAGWVSIPHPDDLPSVKAAWQYSLETGEAFEVETRFKHHSGQYRWMRVWAHPAKDANGRVIAWYGSNTDIHKKRMMLQAIEQSEARYRQVFESDLIGMAIGFIDGTLIEVNECYAKMVGYSRDDVVSGKVNWAALTPADYLDVEMMYLARMRETGEPQTYEKQYIHRDGHRIDILIYATFMDADQQIILGLVQNITERKQYERALVQSETRFRQLAENHAVGVIFWDLDGDIWDANDVLLNLLGYTREELRAGKLNWKAITPEQWQEQDAKAAQEIIDLGKHASFEKQYRHKDGSLIDVMLSGERFAGEERCGFSLVVDIREIKQAKRALEESERQFRTLADSIPQLAWIADGEGWVFWYNQQWYDYTGTNPEEVHGCGWKAVHHPDYRDRVVAFLSDAWTKPEPWEFEFPLRRYDGQWGWFLTRATPVLDREGKIVRWFGTNTDITAQKESEKRFQELYDWEKKTLQIVEALREPQPPDMMLHCLVNQLGEALHVDRVFLLEFDRNGHGLPVSFEYLSHPNFPSIQGRIPPWEECPFAQQAIQLQHPFSTDVLVSDCLDSIPSVKYFVEEFGIRGIMASPIVYHNELLAIVLVHTNQPRQWHERELYFVRTVCNQAAISIYQARAKAELEILSRRKSEFVALMSHELRTPLNSILGYSKMIETEVAGPINEKQRRFAQNVSISGQHLLNIINDLLDVSKIEAGKMQINPEWLDVHAVMAEVNQMMTQLAKEKQVHLMINIQPELDRVFADQGRFRQILLNLINNAIKFNRPGGEVLVRLCWQEDDFVGIIQDTGAGIPGHKQADLFKRFHQVDASSSRTQEGTGLGLALTKDLLELHGGSIQVESEEGSGSTFTFRLPRDASKVVEASQARLDESASLVMPQLAQ